MDHHLGRVGNSDALPIPVVNLKQKAVRGTTGGDGCDKFREELIGSPNDRRTPCPV